MVLLAFKQNVDVDVEQVGDVENDVMNTKFET